VTSDIAGSTRAGQPTSARATNEHSYLAVGWSHEPRDCVRRRAISFTAKPVSSTIADIATVDGLPLYEEDHDSLTLRVERFYLSTAWAENPPSRVRHLITNVEVETITTKEVVVESNFLSYRSRLAERTGEDEHFVVGTRRDTLQQDDEGWKLASRKAVLDSVVLNSHNLSFFV
jgi:3-phenylpropionate/cinnamic acid dioxygenase small subunit